MPDSTFYTYAVSRVICRHGVSIGNQKNTFSCRLVCPRSCAPYHQTIFITDLSSLDNLELNEIERNNSKKNGGRNSSVQDAQKTGLHVACVAERIKTINDRAGLALESNSLSGLFSCEYSLMAQWITFKELHLMLAKFEQESVDTTVLSNIRKELISRSLLASKDKAVKALTACCIADILRLFAPDAPYTENELKVLEAWTSVLIKGWS